MSGQAEEKGVKRGDMIVGLNGHMWKEPVLPPRLVEDVSKLPSSDPKAFMVLRSFVARYDPPLPFISDFCYFFKGPPACLSPCLLTSPSHLSPLTCPLPAVSCSPMWLCA